MPGKTKTPHPRRRSLASQDGQGRYGKEAGSRIAGPIWEDGRLICQLLPDPPAHALTVPIRRGVVNAWWKGDEKFCKFCL